MNLRLQEKLRNCSIMIIYYIRVDSIVLYTVYNDMEYCLEYTTLDSRACHIV